MMSDTSINLTDYTLPQLTLLGCSGLLWLGIYVIILRDARKYRFVAMPMFALCANLAYEFLWAFVFRMNLGSALADGSKAYLLLTLCMSGYILRDGHKQFRAQLIQRHVLLVLTISTLVWGFVLYFFSPAIDDAAGISSASLLHLQMSALFLLMPLRLFEQEGRRGLEKLSPVIGWAKLLASVCMSLACMMLMPERHWVHAVCVLMVAFDGLYLLLYQMLKTSADLQSAGTWRLAPGLSWRLAA